MVNYLKINRTIYGLSLCLFLSILLIWSGQLKAEPENDEDYVVPSLINIPDSPLPSDAGRVNSSETRSPKGSSTTSGVVNSSVRSNTSKNSGTSSQSATSSASRTKTSNDKNKNISKSSEKRSKNSVKEGFTRAATGGFPWGQYNNTKSKDSQKKSGQKSPSSPAPSKTSSTTKTKSPSVYTKPSAPAPQPPAANSTTKSTRRGNASKNSSSTSKTRQVAADSPIQVTIGAPKNISLLAKDRTYNLTVRCAKMVDTSNADEYLAAADDPVFNSIAQLFGASSWQWQSGQKSISVSRGGTNHTLKYGQMQLPESVGGRLLDVGIKEIDGKYYCPISLLEDFLNVRVTVNYNQGKGWVDPLITSVRLNGSGRDLKLDIEATAPVRYSSFTLSQPNRYVIDVAGAVLDTTSLRVNHPEIGDVRLGQFTIGPAISRIVIPTTQNVKVTPPSTRTGSKFSFALQLPQSNQTTKFKKEKLLTCNVSSTGSGKNAVQTVTMGFSGPIKYEWRRLTQGGSRFMIDFNNVVFPENKITKNVSGKMLHKVRISQHASTPSPVTRLVLDLNGEVSVKVRRGSSPSSLALDITDDVIDTQMASLSGSGMVTGTPVIHGGKTICLDAGHGGSDAGCISNAYGYQEKDVTLDICLKLADILQSRGWNVVMTRETDRDVTWAGSSNTQELGARVDVGEKCNADIIVSIHCNAAVSSSAEGTSLHVYKRSDRALAQCIHPHLMKASGRNDRGIQQDRFFVLVNSPMPAVLIETAFLSNPTEAKLLGDENYRLKIAQGLADGICDYGDKYMYKQ